MNLYYHLLKLYYYNYYIMCVVIVLNLHNKSSLLGFWTNQRPPCRSRILKQFWFSFADEVARHSTTVNTMPNILKQHTTASYLTYIWCIVGIVAIILMIIVIVHRLQKFSCGGRLVTMHFSGFVSISSSGWSSKMYMTKWITLGGCSCPLLN